MIVLKWVFPVFLAVLAIVHLISCWRGDDDLRKPTKVALMPVVALAYLAFSCTPSLWVVAGLLFGCLGDLFLLWPLKKKFFVLGTSSFFLGHVCYLIFIYTHYVIRVGWVWIVVISAVYAAGAAFVYANSRRNIPRALRPLSLAYMLMLCVLSVSLILVGQARGVFRRDVLPRVRRRAVRYALCQEGRAHEAELRRHAHVHPRADAAGRRFRSLPIIT